MIYSPHIIVGAVIGAKTQNLGLIVILGIVSHIIMDKLPHWDYSTDNAIKKFRKTKSVKHLMPVIIKATIDVLFGLLVVFLIVWQRNIFNLLPFIIIAIFFSLLFDILGASILLFGTNKLVKKYMFYLYKYFHHSKRKQKEGKTTFLGLATQIIVIIVSVFLLNL